MLCAKDNLHIQKYHLFAKDKFVTTAKYNLTVSLHRRRSESYSYTYLQFQWIHAQKLVYLVGYKIQQGEDTSSTPFIVISSSVEQWTAHEEPHQHGHQHQLITCSGATSIVMSANKS